MYEMQQTELFPDASLLPPGFIYRPEFLTIDEQNALMAVILTLPLAEARYHEFTARRRIVSYGGSYDFSNHALRTAAPIPEFLHPLRTCIAALMDVSPESIQHALIAEYRPGAPLGWHRDVPEFEVVGGVSLQGYARMRLRPYPHRKGDRTALRLELEPRSAYVLRDAARWNWQHAISAPKALRYSITFRTLASETESARRRAED
jgi:alkylated DNA repair dioxygenase AlkB